MIGHGLGIEREIKSHVQIDDDREGICLIL